MTYASLLLKESTTDRRRRSMLKGWRAGVAASATMTAAVLLVNVVLTVWASLRYPLKGEVGDAYVGNCSVVDV